jgi:hypothetical protein
VLNNEGATPSSLTILSKGDFTMAKERVYPTIEHIQKVTLFKSKKQAQGALETLIWLDQGAPHKFDGLKGNYRFAMDMWRRPIKETDYANEMDCGTACCLAGAIWSFAKKLGGDVYDDGPSEDWFFAVEDEYGDSYIHPDLFNLFYANDTYDLSAINPKQAAKTLRKYLKTGEVDWSHLDC